MCARVQMEPWQDRPTWDWAIQRPVEAGDRHAQAVLLRLLQPSHGGIMWRTSKNSVAEELGIPKQVRPTHGARELRENGPLLDEVGAGVLAAFVSPDLLSELFEVAAEPRGLLRDGVPLGVPRDDAQHAC